MKKLLFLLPAVIGGVLLTGCVDEVVVARPAPAPVYYGDPYYVYGDVNYYNEGGRYYYWNRGARIYVGGLPHGGYYFHNGRHYRHYNRGRWY